MTSGLLTSAGTEGRGAGRDGYFRRHVPTNAEARKQSPARCAGSARMFSLTRLPPRWVIKPT